MVKRLRGSKITPLKEQEWLRRHQAGESAPEIAKKDGVDVRTVRRHLEHVMNEEERREARLTVLRSALERHYVDLVEYAKYLDSEVSGRRRNYGLAEVDHMRLALKQHLPRSPLWSYLNKRHELEEELRRLENDLQKRLQRGVEHDPRLESLGGDTKGIAKGIAEALVFQTKCQARGVRPLDLDRNLVPKPVGGDEFEMIYGPAYIGKGSKKLFETVKEMLREKESQITRWKECREFQRLFQELEHVNENLRDELAVIILRRVLPGRCMYCPV